MDGPQDDAIIEPVELEPGDLKAAEEAGLTDVRCAQVYTSASKTIIHARWRGAPIVISGGGAWAGGFGVTFYTGEHLTEPIDEEDKPEMSSGYDEIRNSDQAEPAVLIRLAAVLLTDEYVEGREHTYQDVPSPPGW